MDIHFEGRISRQDFYRAHVLHMKPSRLLMWLRIGAAAFFILALLRTYTANPSNWQPLVLLAFPVILATTPWWMPFYKTSAYSDPKNPLKDPILGIASPVGVVMSGPSFKSSMRWETYSHHKIGNSLVLLYQGGRGFNLFPRSLFKSDTEWEGFVRLVEAKTLPAPRKYVKSKA